jgi:hypothetical protein
MLWISADIELVGDEVETKEREREKEKEGEVGGLAQGMAPTLKRKCERTFHPGLAAAAW